MTTLRELWDRFWTRAAAVIGLLALIAIERGFEEMHEENSEKADLLLLQEIRALRDRELLEIRTRLLELERKMTTMTITTEAEE